MTRFTPGETVRLTARFAGVMEKRSRRRIAWTERRGVVAHCNQNSVYVIWAGCKSPDPLPIAAVEGIAA